jgi:ABC-type sugar transport system substrate-binding protein
MNFNITLNRDINPLVNYDHLGLKQGRNVIHLTPTDAKALINALQHALKAGESCTEEITSTL